MKELSIEQKAIAYDGLIERLKDLKFAYRFSSLSDTIDEYFPELKENKDVEPKFKDGDWVTETDGETVFHITIDNNMYQLETLEGTSCHFSYKIIEEKFHLWTIQDAKDGDVLADGNLPFIFKKIDANNYSYAYCGISVDEGFKIESDGESDEWTWMQDIKPATKEQRELLFQKMKEAGYVWDDEKKKLKKIEQKPVEWHREDEQNLNACLGYIPDEFLRRWLTDTIHVKYDKVEPKFKVGDWVVNKFGNVWHIDSFDKKNYQVSNGNEYNYFPISKQDEMHLWTIQDAKDGDVLATNKYYENISIFKENHYNIENGKGFLFVHCIYDCNNHHFYPMTLASQEKNYHPATKEQRELLFEKIHEAGYEWDAEHKQLKKIEQTSVWSEEDEEIHRKCICAMRASACGFPEEEKFVEQVDNWLKSLKDRVQPQQQCSEEDEDTIKFLISHFCVSHCNRSFQFTDNKLITHDELLEKIRNLRHQSTWKPNDEQMKVLRYLDKGTPLNDFDKRVLHVLIDQLKKLREE